MIVYNHNILDINNLLKIFVIYIKIINITYLMIKICRVFPKCYYMIKKHKCLI